MAGDNAGRSVSSAGDVNGDGFDDLIVGAPVATTAAPMPARPMWCSARRRASARWTASAGGDRPHDALGRRSGFIIQGDAANDHAGFSVSAAGDVNGDGFDDLIVGARLGDDGGTNAGEAYVVFGKASGFGTVDGTGRR